MDLSAEWKVELPLLSETTTEVAVCFGATQKDQTSKTQTSKTEKIDRSAEITLPPMTTVKATAQYTESVLAVNAVLKFQRTYTNGVIQTSNVPATYTGVSRYLAEIKLEDA